MVSLNKTGSANGTVGVTVQSKSSATVTLSGITGDGTLGISIAQGSAVDASGNRAPAAGPSTTFTVDNTGPAVSIGAPSSTLTKSGPITYTVSYTGATAITLSSAGITLNKTGSANGTVAVTGSGTSTRTVTISGITGDGTLGISVGSGTATDSLGNAATASAPSATFTVDNTGPQVSISAPSASATNAGPVTFTVSYTGATAITLASTDVTLIQTGTANGTVAVSGTGTASRTVTVSGITGDGTLAISLASSTASDSLGNLSVAAGPSSTFNVDNTGPAVTIGAPSATLTRSGPITYTVSYADAANVSLTSANVTLNKTGTASGTVAVSGTGVASRTVTISSITGDGTLSISVGAGTATDTLGNVALAMGPSTAFTVDNTGPAIAIGAPSATVTKSGPVSYTVTYTDAAAVTLTSANVSLVKTGTANGSVAVSGTGTSTRTVTISGITGDGVLGISIPSGTASDSLGNLSTASGISTTFTVDNTPPTFSVGSPSPAATNAGPVSFAVVYTGASSISLTAADVTLNKGGTANGTVSVSGSGTFARTVTVSGITGNGTLGISIAAGTATDAAGNLAAASGASTTFTVDNIPPTVSLSAPSATIAKSGPITYTVSYSGANAISLTAAQVSLNKTGTANGTVAVSGTGLTSRTVTISNITGDGALGIAIAAGSASDSAGNQAPAVGPSATFAADNTGPVPTISLIDANPTSTSKVNFQVAFNETPVGFDETDITVTGSAEAQGRTTVTLSGSGLVYNVEVRLVAANLDAEIGIAIGAGVTDSAGNASPGASSPGMYHIDHTAPTATIALVDPLATTGSVVHFKVDFSEPMATEPTATNVTVTGTLAANATATVSGSGGSYTVTVSVSGAAYEGTIGISLAGGSLKDLSGNPFKTTASQAEYTLDNTGPSLSIGPASVQATAGESVSYVVTYSGASTITLSAADVTLNKTGTAQGTVAVTGSGSLSRTVTISNVTGDGTLGISIASNTAVDGLGNNATAVGPSGTVAVDNTPPTMSIGTPSVSLTNAGPVTYTVSYTGADAVTLSAADVSLNTSGTASGTVSVTGTGTESRTVTVSSITGEGTVGISLAAGSASDRVGHTCTAAGPSATFTVDNAAPTAAITLADITPTQANTVHFNVDFSEPLSPELNASDVSLTGTAAAGATLSVTGSNTHYVVAVTTWEASYEGTLGISIPSGAVSDAAGNVCAGTASAEYTVDNTGPSVTIGAPSATSVGAGPLSFTVSYAGAETIDLKVDDVLVQAKGSAKASVSVSGEGNASRTVTFSNITGEGSLTFAIRENSASDALGNNAGQAGPSATVTVDNTAPTLWIGSPSVTQTRNGPVTYLLSYMGASQITLAASDVTLVTTGTANGTVQIGGSGTAFRTVTISNTTGDGTLGISIKAGTAHDLAGNPAPAGASAETVAVDNTDPTVAIGTPSAASTKSGPVSYALTYSDATNITLNSLHVVLLKTGTANGKVAVTGSGTTSRTVTISNITGDGTLGISIAAGSASDAGGRMCSAAGPSATFVVDNTAPVAVFAQTDASPTKASEVHFNVDFDGPVYPDLDSSNIVLTGSASSGATAVVTGTNPHYVVTVSVPNDSNEATLGISIPGGAVSDAVGNAYAGGASAEYTVDNTGPSVVIGAPSATSVGAGPFSFTVSYTGAETIDLKAGDVLVDTQGTAKATVSVSGEGNAYRTVSFSDITGDGSLAFSLRQHTASDALGNLAASAGPSATVTVDNTAPGISVGSPSVSQTKSGPVTYVVAYSGASEITLDASAVTLEKTGTANGTIEVGGSGFDNRIVTISKITGNGTLGISIQHGSARDSGGNRAPAAVSTQSVIVESTRPLVALTSTVPEITNSTIIPVTVTFSEDVNGFSAEDLVATNGTVQNFAGSGASYSFDLLPADQGSVTVAVVEDACTGVGGAGNLAASLTRTFDNAGPNAAVSATKSSTRTSVATYTVEFDEAVAQFDSAEDLVITESKDLVYAAAIIASLDQRHYRVTVTGLEGEGELTLSVATDSDVRDLTGNALAASSEASVSVLDGRFHSADINKDDGINLKEVLRVIAYYNAGSYHCDSSTPDAYAPYEGDRTGEAHSSDYLTQDWSISAEELLRTVSFYNAGAYHADPAMPDGFAPGIATKPAVAAAKALSGPAFEPTSVDVRRTVSCGSVYPADGGFVDVTIEILPEYADEIYAIALEETLPEGWVFDSVLEVSNDNAPIAEPVAGASGTLDFVWLDTPEFPLTLKYRVYVPAGETGKKSIVGQALYVDTTGQSLRSPEKRSTLGLVRSACDVNSDGNVDAVDVQIIVNAALGLGEGAEADATGDNKVDAADVQKVINSVMGRD